MIPCPSCEWNASGTVVCAECDGTRKITSERGAELAQAEDRRLNRIARGVSLLEEAKRLGISAVALSDLEHGRTAALRERERELARFADALLPALKKGSGHGDD